MRHEKRQSSEGGRWDDPAMRELAAEQWAEWRTTRRRIVQTGFGAGAAFALAGTGGFGGWRTGLRGAAAQEAPTSGGSINMGIVADVQSFDPPIPGDNMSIWTMLNIYDQVLRVAQNGEEVEPCLAESYELSDDLLTYTFNLRPGVVFHDGTPLKASDVKYCLDRTSFAEDSSWLSLFTAVDTTEAPDDTTFVLKVKEPWAPMLANMALFAASIYPEAAHKELGADLFEAPIGTGPFVFDSWQKGAAIVLKKNPNYWIEGQPYLDEVTFSIVADANTRVVQLQGGDMDIASDAPFSQIESLDADDNIDVLVAPVGRVDYVAINHTRPPFDDVKVRQALNYAVDKEAIIQAVLYGQAQVAQSALPRMRFWNEETQPYPYDPEMAKQLLSESSAAGGFATTLGVTAGEPVDGAVATILKDQLAAIGVEVEIYEQEGAALYVDTFQGMDYDLVIQYHTTDTVDASQITRYAMASRADGTGALWTGYVNPRIDELASQALAEQDPDKRQEMYYEIQKLGFDDAFILYLYFPDSRTAIRTGINDFQILPTANYRMWEV
ncbi:MAG: ABC transporter substrate-binding protein, partial [Chloroflexota bacterium]|nr:ABC transporter substrate-binding protein [Chloroflexota bacterium]